MRAIGYSILALTLPWPHGAEEGGASGGGLMSPQPGLMFWTLLIFLVLLYVLSKLAFKPILRAVEAREKALEEALEQAKRDRDAAAKLLAEHQARLESARGEAQKLLADGRATAEKIRSAALEKTRLEQQEMLERARHEIDRE